MARKKSDRGPKKEPEQPSETEEKQVDVAPAAEGIPEIEIFSGQDEEEEENQGPLFAVVGLGASAGGLEACSQLLESLPEQISFAMILVQHMAPHHKSSLPELLALKTHLPVLQIQNGMRIEAGKIYIIPPDIQLYISPHGTFELQPRTNERVQHMPIDIFFRSLAEFGKERAVGVVLSGTATDGVIGLREIKVHGGITIAQKPETAKYDGMPRAAIATDVVDLVLSPSEMANELVKICEQANIWRAQIPVTRGLGMDEEQLGRIFAMLRASTGVDFTNYKTPTVRRRLQRRIHLQKLASVDLYIQFLQENPSEVQSLYRDILIHVTRFFREPDSFETLKEVVYPAITKNRQGEGPVRIWIPGCSTGEEAYSIAITLLEYLRDEPTPVPVQIFATDVSESAIERARSGIYPNAITEDVSSERLHRFFNRMDGSFQISKVIRDMCVFARQDLTRDPPFSRLDMIVCRNVLIYLAPSMQKKLMAIFHYGLKPNGFLVLGAAETVGPYSDLFFVADKKHRVYTKKIGSHNAHMQLPVDYKPRFADVTGKLKPDKNVSLADEADRFLLTRYSPPGVVVDQNLHIIQFRGQTGKFLEPAPGEASLNLLRMAREGLLHGLRNAIRDARRDDQPVRREGLHVHSGTGLVAMNLEIVPLSAASHGERNFLILFEEQEPKRDQPTQKKNRKKSKKPPNQEDELAALQQELAASREYLQTIIQDLEAANEELQSANEEILSSNEELQSTNEELDTAKEELQSTNEELNTVNEELHNRNDELRKINSDLLNLLANVQIAIVMVDSQLRIRRFTPLAERMLNLIPGDVGRPIGHIQPNIQNARIDELILASIDSVDTIIREVQDREGHWYSLRIRPYKNLDDRIDGAVLALIDIDTAKRHQAELEKARDYSEAVVQTIQQPLAVLDSGLRISKVNKAFADLFGLEPEAVVNHLINDIGAGEWRDRELRTLLNQVLLDNASLENFSVTVEIPNAENRTILVNARRVVGRDGRPHSVLLAIKEAFESPE